MQCSKCWHYDKNKYIMWSYYSILLYGRILPFLPQYFFKCFNKKSKQILMNFNIDLWSKIYKKTVKCGNVRHPTVAGINVGLWDTLLSELRCTEYKANCTHQYPRHISQTGHSLIPSPACTQYNTNRILCLDSKQDSIRYISTTHSYSSQGVNRRKNSTTKQDSIPWLPLSCGSWSLTTPWRPVRAVPVHHLSDQS